VPRRAAEPQLGGAMSTAQAFKKLAIETNLYLPVRWLKRRLDSGELEAHLELMRLYRSLIAEDSLCFDVGANIGAVSEALLKVGARVIAFEPNPTVLPELQARCGRHKNWSLVPAAIGNQADIATLYERKLCGQSSLGADWEGEVIATHNVPVITLDAAIRRFGAPAYCKIDVEGYELQVLEGLTQPISLLSFEFHLTPRDIEKTIACLKHLQSFGPARVNVTSAERSTLHFKEWVVLADFTAQFPQQLEKSLLGKPYGDLWVHFEAS
jgi:FkbM family methyltransferase